MNAALLDYVKPTHFITISAKRAVSCARKDGFNAWIRCDDIALEKYFRSYMRSASKALTPKTVWNRRKPIMPFVASIEGDGLNSELHFHAVIQKPANVSYETFEAELRKTAERNPCMKQGPFSFDIQEIAKTPYKLMSYITKKGHERLIF